MSDDRDPLGANAQPVRVSVATQDPPSASTANRHMTWLKWGTITTGLAAAADFVGNLGKVEHFAISLLGSKVAGYLHYAMTAMVVLALVVGITSLIRWLHTRVEPRTRLAKGIFVLVTTMVVLAIGTAAIAFAPRPPSTEAYVAEETSQWVDRMRGLERESGGIATNFLDPQAETQVWTSAQVLTGLFMSDRPPSQQARPALASNLVRSFTYINRASIRGSTSDLLGWGYFEDWPMGVTEIAGWVGVAYGKALQSPWAEIWSPNQRAQLEDQSAEVLDFLIRTQQGDGGWGPTRDRAGPSLSRTYSTVMALWAVAEISKAGVQSTIRLDDAVRNATVWLLTHYSEKLGWVPNPFRTGQNERFLGLTAQTLYVLQEVQSIPAYANRLALPQYQAAVSAFIADPALATRSPELNDRLHDSDRYVRTQRAASDAEPACFCPFTIEGSTFLWYPWSLAAAAGLSTNNHMRAEVREQAEGRTAELKSRLPEAQGLINTGMSYVTAEFLIGLGAAQLAKPVATPAN